MFANLFLSFPNFNLYSTPLLILTLQGLIFAVLLYLRYFAKRNLSDLLLATILLITCYHRTTYTIGFMDWYDTFQNTKINYYLINMELLLGPLLYFYVRSITSSDFRITKGHVWHFIPWILFFIVKLFIFIYDVNQPGFDDTQNGYMVENFQWQYVDPIVTVFGYGQMLLYFAFTFQLYYAYRRNIQQFFSNAFSLELNWIRNFLWIYALLFLYGIGQNLINVVFTELSWTQKWWLQFFNALALIYVGVKGYFTDTERLKGLEFDGNMSIKESNSRFKTDTQIPNPELDAKLDRIQAYFKENRPYLDPELNLITLSRLLEMSRAELSEVINLGFGMNFNDFINSHRVEAVKEMLESGKHSQLSLLGIAYECGFNSKATFNRVFKKFTQQSPSQYLTS